MHPSGGSVVTDHSARIAVFAEPARTASGLVDFSERLADELRRHALEATTSRERNVDAIVYSHAPYAAGALVGWLRAARHVEALSRDASLIVVFHEVFERPDTRLRMRLFEQLQRWSFARLDAAAAATVVADSFRADALRRLVPGAKEPVVIPVGPNIDVPPRVRPRAAEPVVVVFGLLHPNRDVETVVEAAALLRAREPDLRVLVIGDLAYDQGRARALRARAAELGAPVELTGRLPAEEVEAQLARARAFVSTYVDSVSLGSGSLAAACGWGLPTVVYAEARRHAALVPGRTVFVAERRADALADALARALGPDGDAVGDAARELYERELSWSRIGERYAALLGRVL